MCSFLQGQVPCLYVPALYPKHQAQCLAKTRLNNVWWLGKKKNESLIDLMHIVLICCSPNCSFLFVCLYFRNFFFFSAEACEILFPQPGIEPISSSHMGAQTLNYWTTREVPQIVLVVKFYFPKHILSVSSKKPAVYFSVIPIAKNRSGK